MHQLKKTSPLQRPRVPTALLGAPLTRPARLAVILWSWLHIRTHRTSMKEVRVIDPRAHRGGPLRRPRVLRAEIVATAGHVADAIDTQ